MLFKHMKGLLRMVAHAFKPHRGVLQTGNQLKAARALVGIEQRELAEAAGVLTGDPLVVQFQS